MDTAGAEECREADEDASLVRRSDDTVRAVDEQIRGAEVVPVQRAPMGEHPPTDRVAQGAEWMRDMKPPGIERPGECRRIPNEPRQQQESKRESRAECKMLALAAAIRSARSAVR